MGGRAAVSFEEGSWTEWWPSNRRTERFDANRAATSDTGVDSTRQCHAKSRGRHKTWHAVKYLPNGRMRCVHALSYCVLFLVLFSSGSAFTRFIAVNNFSRDVPRSSRNISSRYREATRLLLVASGQDVGCLRRFRWRFNCCHLRTRWQFRIVQGWIVRNFEQVELNCIQLQQSKYARENYF